MEQKEYQEIKETILNQINTAKENYIFYFKNASEMISGNFQPNWKCSLKEFDRGLKEFLSILDESNYAYSLYLKRAEKKKISELKNCPKNLNTILQQN